MDFTAKMTSRLHNDMLDGDLVIIYERHDSLDYVFLESGKILNCKHGSFYHDDFLKKPFGSKIYCRSSAGWIYALKPTPELWSLALHTRTQIVDEVDAAVVTFKMGIQPGCIVVESGTGSGSLSQSLMRAVYPTGHLYTFEYNPARADLAREEFKRLGLEDSVTVKCRDVCGKSGAGGFEGAPRHGVDAVFLDLPEPWLAVQHVLDVLKPGRTVCSYSPCIGQVEKTCEALRTAGFHSIHMIEVRRRPFDGRTTSLEVPRLHPECMQTAVSENPIIDACNNSGNSSAEGDAPERTRKRAKFEPLSEEGVGAAEEEAKEGAGKRAWNKWAAPVDLPSRSLLVARPLSEMKGHTAFLTFAVRPSRTKLSASCGATGDNAETSVEEVLGEPKNTANDLQAI